MIPRISVGSEQITIDDIWEHYETVRDSIVRDLEEAKRSLIGEKSLQDPRLIGMDLDELNSHFAGILDEVDTQASLFILAATEATMRVDFLSRVYEKKKDPVSRSFRSTYASRCKHNKVNVRLEEDILDTWVDLHPETKSDIGRLKGAIGYRHWLAHGRYWVPKLGERYDPIGLVQMITNFFEKIGLNGLPAANSGPFSAWSISIGIMKGPSLGCEPNM